MSNEKRQTLEGKSDGYAISGKEPKATKNILKWHNPTPYRLHAVSQWAWLCHGFFSYNVREMQQAGDRT